MPTYPFTLTMLSPVHIGTGEEIDPSEYVVTAEKAGDDAQYVVDVLDLPAFLGSLTPAARREFDDAVAKNALFYLRRFVADRCDRRRFRRYWCATGREFYEHYRKGLTSDASQLVVNTMTRTGLDGRPYVPGSSLKGSLRTAVVSTLALEAARDPQIADDLDGIARDDHRHREFEPTVLGYRNARGRAEIRADPFRAVRVSDAPLPPNAISIDPATIYKPDADAGAADPAGIRMYYQMTFSALDGESVEARGTIAVDERLAHHDASSARDWRFAHCVSRALTIGEILEACRRFYVPRLERENEAFYRRHPDAADAGRRLLEMARAMKDNEALIRLGRFSHFECVTVERFARPPRRGCGGTRTFAAGMLPMGWAKLAVGSPRSAGDRPPGNG